MKFGLFVCVILLVINCGFGLKDVRVVFPKSVPEGGVANLFCLYDLENEPLYSVKWYRGNYEFFRYLPKEKPRIMVFFVPGLYVDIESSSSYKLTLLDVPKYLAGNFTCEVSTDEPKYATRHVTKVLVVTPSDDQQKVAHKMVVDKTENLTKPVLSNNISDYSNFNQSLLYKNNCGKFLFTSNIFVIIGIVHILFIT